MLVFNPLEALWNWVWDPEKKTRSLRFTTLTLEWLEQRLAPSITTKWTGTIDDAWDKAGNWSNGVPDSALYDVKLRDFGTGNTAPTIKAGESYTVNSISDEKGFNSLQIAGSLTLKSTSGDASKIAFGNIYFASGSATLDIQEDFTFSSTRNITSLTSKTGLLSIDSGGSMTVTGAAKQLDVSVDVGGPGGPGTLTFVDLASNVTMKSGRDLTVARNGTVYFSQATNSGTCGGLTSEPIFDSGLIERTGNDTATLGVNATILLVFGGNLKLDAGTSVSTTSVNVLQGLLEMGASSSLTTSGGVRLNDASAELFVDGQAAANTSTNLSGDLIVNSGHLVVGANEGAGFFTNLNVAGAANINGGTAYMAVLGGAGNNNKCDTIVAFSTTLAAAATLSVQVQNGVQPVVGNSYQLVFMFANAGPGFGSITTTDAPVLPTWKGTLGAFSYTISIQAGGALKGKAFNDADGNHRKDAGEAVLTNVAVALAGSDGSSYTTQTAADGTYEFDDLTLGVTYTVSASTPSGDTLEGYYADDGTPNTTASFTPTSTQPDGNIDAAFVAATGTGTTTSLTASTLVSTVNQPVTFSVSVSPTGGGMGFPSGSVQLYDGTTLLASAAISAGSQASFAISSLAVGSHDITAYYGGNGTYSSSTSPVVTETVQQGPPSTSFIMLSESSQYASVGNPVTFAATVSSGNPSSPPTGTVSFYDTNGVLLATIALEQGMSGMQAALTTSSLAVGNHTITATYNGDANDAPTSASVSFYVMAS